jgi:hypothetical protein
MQGDYYKHECRKNPSKNQIPQIFLHENKSLDLNWTKNHYCI